MTMQFEANFVTCLRAHARSIVRRWRVALVSASMLVAAAGCDVATEDPAHSIEGGGAVAQALAVETQTATLADLWAGRAEWKLMHSLTRANTGWEYGYGGGSRIQVVNGVWYHFGSKYHWGQKCGGDKTTLDRVGVIVRKSTDRGFTWGAPVEIIPPASSTPWDCMAVDGSYYFDARIGRWHYLFQCLADTGAWQLCYLQSAGSDPTVPVNNALTVTVHANPVTTPGDLWDRICDQTSDHCSEIAGGPGLVSDEGTPDIF
ncbi:MAG TPA: hypothetical protein VNM90_18760, partial [Haliangium sp.]|nr:hypothetical protein [Haliangium sp.]